MAKSKKKSITESLKIYHSKRDFNDSPEPKGDIASKKTTQKNHPIFVIQKHDATRLHYDLRLEINGVLKSWAIPKGPSTNPSDKRLAIETEDHPMDYATFEGVIPEGNYGAGPVIVWDRGTYENIKEKNGLIIPVDECYEMGQIEVELHGEKLQGAYALIRTHLDNDDNQKKWLCIKMDDEYVDARKNPIKTQPESVISHKTIKELETHQKKKPH